MSTSRRRFLKTALAASAAASMPLVPGLRAAESGDSVHYPYHGRTHDYVDFQVIEPGRKIAAIESFVRGALGIVRITTDDGAQGYGQLSTYDTDISAMVLHRKVAAQVLGQDPAHIDRITDRVIESNYKYPWSYICRALCGVDTAIWDLYGKLLERPIVELLGGTARPQKAYGSSMRRNISPADEAARLRKLQAECGYEAFKIRVGQKTGHNRDASPGRTEALIPTVREAVASGTRLLADGNSCYTPDRAIEIGRLMEEHDYFMFEEPCPYWEYEWTKEVTDRLTMQVSGGEQDNDLGGWRRMIGMHAVDVVQPDICYIGGLTRAIRVAKMAQEKGLAIVPHSANHSLVTVFALHLLGAVKNAAPYLEFSIEPGGLNAEATNVYQPSLVAVDGAVAIPSAPGWGVEINPKWLESATYQKSERQA